MTVNSLGGLPKVMNAIRNSGSEAFQNTIPSIMLGADGNITQESFRSYATGILTNKSLFNEWSFNLVNRIGLTVLKNRAWANPLATLKKQPLEYGDTIQEIFTNLINAQKFEPLMESKDAGKIFRSAPPESHVVFHTINREEFYEVSVSRVELERAFLTPRNLEDFINSIFIQLYSSDEIDEYRYMKLALENYINKGLAYRVSVPVPTDRTSTDLLLEKVKAYATKFTFPSTIYNAYGVEQHCPRDKQVVFISADMDAKIDVQSLAAAFNMDKAEFLARKIVVDNMPAGTHLVLASQDLLVVHDTLYRMEDLPNAMTLEMKYFYHRHGIISTSRFENAVVFTSDDVSEPKTVSIKNVIEDGAIKGSMFPINSEVLNEEGNTTNVPQAVMYSVAGANNQNTKIDLNGYLTIAYDETAPTITVRVSSLHFPDVYADLEIIIKEQ